MANARHVIEIAVEGQDNASSIIGGVGGSILSLQGILTGGAAAIVAAGAAAVGGVAAVAINTADDINDASNTIQRSLGDNADAAINYRSVLENVFSENLGDNFNDIANAIVEVERNTRRLGDISQPTLEQMAQGALFVRDNFDQSTNESISAATTLMEQFGLTGTQAYDFIVAGVQRGLDSSGDFLDTINEYSVQFSQAGADAGQFFSLLESGIGGGTFLGTDRVADLFGEFRKRILDGSKLTRDSIERIGLDADQVLGDLSNQNTTVAETFQQIVQAIDDTEDPITRMRAGVGLLGTQFEDLGGVRGLTLVTTQMEDLEGALENARAVGQDFQRVFRGFGRQFALALAPAGEAILELVNANMPALEAAVQRAAEAVGNLAQGFAELVVDFSTGFAEGGVFAGIGNVLSNALDNVNFDIQAGIGDFNIGDEISGSVNLEEQVISLNWDDYVTEVNLEEKVIEFSWEDKVIGVDLDDEVTTLEWGDWVSSVDWDDWIASHDWGDFLYRVNWDDHIAEVGWGEFIATLDWGSYFTSFQWGDYIVAINWSEWIISIVWGDFVKIISWESFVSSLEWNGWVSVLDWGGYIISLAWDAYVVAVNWPDYLVALVWDTFVAVIDWAGFIPDVDWGSFVPNIDWAGFVPNIAWSSFVPNIAWGSYVPNISWSSFVPRLSWSGLVPRLNWGSFITRVNLRALVPAFPGWTSIARALGFSAPASNQAGTDFFSGGLSLVHAGEVLVQPPRGTRIVPADRVESLLSRASGGSGGDTFNIYIQGGGSLEATARAVQNGIMRSARARGRR